MEEASQSETAASELAAVAPQSSGESIVKENTDEAIVTENIGEELTDIVMIVDNMREVTAKENNGKVIDRQNNGETTVIAMCKEISNGSMAKDNSDDESNGEAIATETNVSRARENKQAASKKSSLQNPQDATEVPDREKAAAQNLEYATQDADEEEAAADCWRNLPVELLAMVISRLPVRLICRLRCLSKWLSYLPTDPLFINLTSSKNLLISPSFIFFSPPAQNAGTAPSITYLSEDRHNYSSISLDFLPSSFSRPVLRSSSAGLLLLSSQTSADHNHISLLVCNPITRSYQTLASPSLFTSPGFIDAFVHIDLDCDVSKLTYTIAVSGSSVASPDGTAIEIYTSENRTWTPLPRLSSRGLLRALAVMNGKLFLLRGTSDSEMTMEVVDLSSIGHGGSPAAKVKVELGLGLGVWWMVDRLGKSSEGLVVVGKKQKRKALDVWLWKDNGNGSWMEADGKLPWMEICTIEHPGLTSLIFTEAAFAGDVVCIWSKYRDKIQSLYDLNEKKKDPWIPLSLPDHHLQERFWPGWHLHPFQATFFSPT